MTTMPSFRGDRSHLHLPLSVQNLVIVPVLVATAFLDQHPLFLRVAAVPLACLIVAASLYERRSGQH